MFLHFSARRVAFWLVALVLAGCAGAAAEPTPTTAPTTAAPTALPSPTFVPSPTVVGPTAPAATAEASATAAPPEEPTSVPVPTAALPTSGEAFGKPRPADVWSRGNKLGVGTAYTYDQAVGEAPAPSRLWFTITGGAITDLLFPTVGSANARELSLLVAGPGGVQHEADVRNPLPATIEYLDPQALAYRVTTSDPEGRWTATKEVVTDPTTDALVTRWRFEGGEGFSPYAYFLPRLGNSGRDDVTVIGDGVVISRDEKAGRFAALLADPAPTQSSVGFAEQSDGLTDLQDGRMDWTFDRLPTDGRAAVTLALPADGEVTLVVGFGESEEAAVAAARTAMERGFETVADEYIAGWQRYLSTLQAPADPDPLYWVSAMVLKAHEDKTFHGAGVASLSRPWGQCRSDGDAREQGYRYVWPRDLYHVAMAYLAIGDEASAQSTLAYLDEVLQRDDGSFPQNAFLDGRPFWTSLQMDEVADPILLAWFLKAGDRYESLVKPSANFIVEKGPVTPQERWEENGGYSPHSIAAQIAALVAAADLADQAGDSESATRWRATADEWSESLDEWTFTTSGPLGDGEYYLRVTPDGNPNGEGTINITNNIGPRPMREVVDVSTLELVRLGVRPPADAQVAATLPEIDEALRVETPRGPAWQRYTYDGYGEPERGRCAPGTGQLWPIFNGERGLYALANGDTETATAMLGAMEAFANEGLMLPEQVYAEDGAGTGSATPLAWAHAEYLILARSLQEGRVLDRPEIVALRYGR